MFWIGLLTASWAGGQETLPFGTWQVDRPPTTVSTFYASDAPIPYDGRQVTFAADSFAIFFSRKGYPPFREEAVVCRQPAYEWSREGEPADRALAVAAGDGRFHVEISGLQASTGAYALWVRRDPGDGRCSEDLYETAAVRADTPELAADLTPREGPERLGVRNAAICHPDDRLTDVVDLGVGQGEAGARVGQCRVRDEDRQGPGHQLVEVLEGVDRLDPVDLPGVGDVDAGDRRVGVRGADEGGGEGVAPQVVEVATVAGDQAGVLAPLHRMADRARGHAAPPSRRISAARSTALMMFW